MKKLLQKIKSNFRKRHLIQLIIMTVCFLIGCAVCYTNEIEPRKQDAYTIDPVDETEDTALYRLVNGESITQDFIYGNNQMIAVGVMLYSDSDENEGELHLTLTDLETGELLGESTKDVSEIVNMEKNNPTDEDVAYVNVGMPTIIEGMDGKPLRLNITVSGLSPDTNLEIFADPYHKSTGYAKAEVTGTKDPRISILVRGYCYLYNFWGFYFRVFAVLLYLMLFASYVMIFVLEAPLHRVFLIAGLVLGITVNFLIPPVTVPDEMVHYATAYYYSNELLGVEEPENISARPDDERMYVRQTDLDALSILKTTPDLKEYAYIHWNLFRQPSSEELVMLEAYKQSDNWTLYIPGILGVTLGRLFGLNGITTIYLGRFFATLFYLAFFYFAIRIIPVGKAAVFVLATCPIVLQQCCSYSYDALPIEVAVLFFCGLLRILFYCEEVGAKQAIFLAVTIFLLASCKGGVYIPFCFCVFLIPAEQYRSVKAKRLLRLMFVLAMVAGFGINTLNYLLQVLHVIEPKTATQSYSESLNPYTVRQVVTDPVHTIYVLINTVLIFADYLVKGMISGPLGWLNIDINPFWAYFQYALLFVGVTTVRSEPGYITKKQKLAFFFAFLLLFLMSAASMLISWTTQGNTTVRGLQGRYFTPMLLPLLFLFRGSFFTIKENVDGKIAYLQLGVSVICVYNILTSVSAVQ